MRFFLLPEDVDLILAAIGKGAGSRLLQDKSVTNKLTGITQKTAERSRLIGELKRYDRCYLAPVEGVPIRSKFIESQGYWLVDSESEAIEFDGCPYNEFFLLQGRFYYQTDLLSPTKDAIVLKSKEFILWAEQIFRSAKKLMKYDKELQAYIGPATSAWHMNGGRFLESEATMPRSQPTARACLI